MGELKDRVKGLANEAAGNTKQAIGDAADNARLHEEGRAQERRGEAQQVEGKIKGALGNDI